VEGLFVDSMGMVTERVWRIKLKTSYEGVTRLLVDVLVGGWSYRAVCRGINGLWWLGDVWESRWC